jgi:hypothetical protein
VEHPPLLTGRRIVRIAEAAFARMERRAAADARMWAGAGEARGAALVHGHTHGASLSGRCGIPPRARDRARVLVSPGAASKRTAVT